MDSISSAAAVTQLGVYTFQSVQYLRDLISQMKSAPDYINSQVTHIELLIKLIEAVCQNAGIQPRATEYFVACLAKAKEIKALLDDVKFEKDGGAIQRVLGARKFKSRQEGLRQLFAELHTRESTLVLFIQNIDHTILLGLDTKFEQLQTELGEVKATGNSSADQLATVVTAIAPISKIASDTLFIPAIASETRLLPEVLAHTSSIACGIAPIPDMAREIKDLSISSKEAVVSVGAMFDDLRKEMRLPNDQMFPSSFNIKPFNNIPRRRQVRNFVGRTDELERIGAAFAEDPENSDSKIVTIYGLGGQGKTQLALEYCRLSQLQGIKGMFWLDANSEDNIKDGFFAIHDIIFGSEHSVKDEVKMSRVIDSLEDILESWMMVFDNYDNPAAFALQEYIPQSKFGRVLITSRNTGVDELSTRLSIPLDGLLEPDAVRLLLSGARLSPSVENEQEATLIVRRLYYVALAVAQASSFIRSCSLPLNQFLTNYEAQKERILRHTSTTSLYRREINNAPNTTLSIFTTWELSYQHLKDIHGEACADFLTLLAFFDHRDIPEEYFRAFCEKEDFTDITEYPHSLSLTAFLENGCWSSAKFQTLIVNLAQNSLVQGWWSDTNSEYHVNLHPLITEWIRLRTHLHPFKACSRLVTIVLKCALEDIHHSRHYASKDREHYEHQLRLHFELLNNHVNVSSINIGFLKKRLPEPEFKNFYRHVVMTDEWMFGNLSRSGMVNLSLTFILRLFKHYHPEEIFIVIDDLDRIRTLCDLMTATYWNGIVNKKLHRWQSPSRHFVRMFNISSYKDEHMPMQVAHLGHEDYDRIFMSALEIQAAFLEVDNDLTQAISLRERAVHAYVHRPTSMELALARYSHLRLLCMQGSHTIASLPSYNALRYDASEVLTTETAYGQIFSIDSHAWFFQSIGRFDEADLICGRNALAAIKSSADPLYRGLLLSRVLVFHEVRRTSDEVQSKVSWSDALYITYRRALYDAPYYDDLLLDALNDYENACELLITSCSTRRETCISQPSEACHGSTEHEQHATISNSPHSFFTEKEKEIFFLVWRRYSDALARIHKMTEEKKTVYPRLSVPKLASPEEEQSIAEIETKIAGYIARLVVPTTAVTERESATAEKAAQ